MGMTDNVGKLKIMPGSSHFAPSPLSWHYSDNNIVFPSRVIKEHTIKEERVERLKKYLSGY